MFSLVRGGSKMRTVLQTILSISGIPGNGSNSARDDKPRDHRDDPRKRNSLCAVCGKIGHWRRALTRGTDAHAKLSSQLDLTQHISMGGCWRQKRLLATRLRCGRSTGTSQQHCSASSTLTTPTLWPTYVGPPPSTSGTSGQTPSWTNTTMTFAILQLLQF